MFDKCRIIRLRRRHQVSKLALLAFVGLVAVSLARNDWAVTTTTLRMALGPNGMHHDYGFLTVGSTYNRTNFHTRNWLLSSPVQKQIGDIQF